MVKFQATEARSQVFLVYLLLCFIYLPINCVNYLYIIFVFYKADASLVILATHPVVDLAQRGLLQVALHNGYFVLVDNERYSGPLLQIAAL